ncbi:pentapeptide repeat-containing protein [Microvirga pakistanensis]|uniref:pentapeptide repeat-containing protein n=1 Tax=Microvirga pakistanensis TaxID=1682650 RepID=UPI00106B4C86|nr:pentapeptide repeat-containing protein [Microvirga pakistanensis]
MANEEHIAKLKHGVDAWNAWRADNPDFRPNFGGADLRGVDLRWADLRWASLVEANLSGANLVCANLTEASLGGANLVEANLAEAILFRAYLPAANLTGANLTRADLLETILVGVNFSEANLTGANLTSANLVYANLSGANLTETNLIRANLTSTDLVRAKLVKADLSGATLVRADLAGADLTDCTVFGISAWKLKLEGAKQESLVITEGDEPEITVDDIEVAQFVYLLLHNPKIRDVIRTIGQKTVLILGRFTEERKKVIDTLREELRKRDYVPILFDFDKPAGRDITETISTLAHMARFVLADITDAKSIPQELSAIVPHLPSVPVQPLLLQGSDEYSMFEHFRRYPWVLPIHCYDTPDQLIANLGERVIHPAETKAFELRGGT